MFLTCVHGEVLSWDICVHSAALGRLADTAVMAKVRYAPGAYLIVLYKSVWFGKNTTMAMIVDYTTRIVVSVLSR